MAEGTGGRRWTESGCRRGSAGRFVMALVLAVSSGACVAHGSTTPPPPGSLDRPATTIDLGASAIQAPIPVARVAIMPVAEGAPRGLAEVLAASVAESLALLAPGVDLVGPGTAAELLAAGRAEGARESAFAYEARSARVDHLAVDRIVAAVGTPWILDLRVDPIEMLEPRRGPEDPERASVPDAFGARVTLWSSGDSEPAWGGIVLIPEAVVMADDGGDATATIRELIARFMSRAPIVSSG